MRFLNKYLFILIIFCSFSFSGFLSSTTTSIGMSETMGFYGFFNRNFDINEKVFITVGTSAIIGGAGIGYKHYFNDSRLTPFVSTAAFGAYTIPMMCGTDDCDIPVDIIISGATGIDLHAIKTNKFNMHLQVGLMTLYSFGDALADSPSNIPELWPIINLKFVK